MSATKVFDVPVGYQVSGRKRRARKEDLHLVVDVVPVSVRHVSADDAPAVVGIHVDDVWTVWRSVGGHVVRPVPLPDDPAGVAKDNAFVDPGGALALHLAGLPAGDRPRVTQAHEMVAVSRSTRDEAVAAAQVHADTLSLVDGVLHVRSPGPVLWVDLDKAYSGIRVSATLDGVEPALACGARDLAWLAEEGLGLVNSVGMADDPVVEVWRPDDLVFDFDAWSLAEAGRRILGSGLGGRASKNMTLDHLRAWLTYNSPGFDAHGENPGLAELLRTCVRTRRGPVPGRSGDEAFARQLDATYFALRRHDARSSRKPGPEVSPTRDPHGR